MKHVIVIGAGFAGLMALNQLVKSKDLKLTLINKNNSFLFTPRLTELLNENISKKIVIKDIKEIFGNKLNFINDKANYIDFNKKYVKTNKLKINYDYLIMSQGATTNFFGNKNIQKNAIGFKDYNAVLKISNKIKDNIKKASKSSKNSKNFSGHKKSQSDFLVNKGKKLLTFAVIGAGLTGIELICSLKEAVFKEVKKYPGINSKNIKFILIQGERTIVPELPAKVRLKIEKHLTNNNIEIMTGNIIKNIKNNIILIKNKKVKAATIIWTAGIKANIIKTSPKLKLSKEDTIKATNKLKIPMYDDVYVAGDAALFIGDNKPLAATAQTAFEEGINIGKNILRRINGKKEKDFHYSHKGTLIVLGSKYGIFNYKSITFGGKLAWHLRHLIYKLRFKQIT